MWNFCSSFHYAGTYNQLYLHACHSNFEGASVDIAIPFPKQTWFWDSKKLFLLIMFGTKLSDTFHQLLQVFLALPPFCDVLADQWNRGKKPHFTISPVLVRAIWLQLWDMKPSEAEYPPHKLWFPAIKHNLNTSFWYFAVWFMGHDAQWSWGILPACLFVALWSVCCML